MAPTLTELLDADEQYRQRVVRNNQIVADAIQAAAEKANTIQAVEPPHVTELYLPEHDGDPFNGNTNNRRVAARIARMPHSHRSKNHDPDHVFHGSNPDKARADVEQSLLVNPEPIIPSPDDMPAIELASTNTKPTPGSPAAKKAEADKTGKGKGKGAQAVQTAAPPTWGSSEGQK